MAHGKAESRHAILKEALRMRRHLGTITLLGFLLLCLVVIGSRLLKRGERGQTHWARVPRDEFSVILDDLYISPWVTNTVELRQRLVLYSNAASRLRALGTNALPRLMEEVRRTAEVRDTNTAVVAVTKVARAFEVLGPMAEPVLPELIEDFRAGRHIGVALAAVASIGKTEGGLAIIEGLTNSDPWVVFFTISALSNFRTNEQVVRAAQPLLVDNLKHPDAGVRAIAASVLGGFSCRPEEVIPELMRSARHDTDVVVRIEAIKAIARYGTNSASVVDELELIATVDPEKNVRRAASNAIHAVQSGTK